MEEAEHLSASAEQNQNHRVMEQFGLEGTLKMLSLTKDLLPTLPPCAGVLSLHIQVWVAGWATRVASPRQLQDGCATGHVWDSWKW